MSEIGKRRLIRNIYEADWQGMYIIGEQWKSDLLFYNDDLKFLEHLKEKYFNIDIQTTFQSRFGPREWLTPYTDKTLESLPNKGVKNLLVICPGFASDCVETLEEINIQGKEIFLKSGGEKFDLIPCLNDNSDHILLFESLVKKYFL